MSGWTLLCTSGAQPYVFFKRASNNPGLACGTSGQVPDGEYGAGPIIPGTVIGGGTANMRWVAFGVDRSIGTVGRMSLDEQWFRNTGDLKSPVPFVPGLPRPYYVPPLTDPWLDPLAIPPLVPLPIPLPPPYRIIPERRRNPRRSPDEQPQRGPTPTPRPSPRPRVKSDPGLKDAWQWDIDPGGKNKPDPQGKQRYHRLRRRKKGDREKKVIFSPSGASALGRLLSFVTEGIDLIDVFFEALPEDIQRGHWDDTPQEKLLLIIEHFEKLRPGTLAANYISEWLEDKAFGKLGKIGARAQRSQWEEGYGSSRPELGPGDTPQGPKLVDEWVNAFDDWLAEHLYSYI